MLRSRFAVAATTLIAAVTGTVHAECRYAEGVYSTGALLCQEGLRMQCRSGEDGQGSWESMDQQCGQPAAAAPAPAAIAVPQSAPAASAAPTADAPAPAVTTPTTAPADARPAESAAAGGQTQAGASTAGVAAPTGAPQVIEILWAVYGRDGKNCDAKPILTERCGGQSECSVSVEPDALCGDLNPERANLLTVYWNCTDGSVQDSQRPKYGQDGTELEMSCG